MITFHIVRDLELFGLVEPGTTLSGFWAIAARVIAGTFLFLSGISLVLAHGQGIRWRPFLERLKILVLAATLVSAATFAIMPERFVYFGILHVLALGSVLAFPLAPRGAWLAIMAAAALIVLWLTFGRGLNLAGWLGWTGLAANPRPSLDLIPVVPWLAPLFLGMAYAKLIAVPKAGMRPWGVVTWIGRHSLAVYLLHQPVLLATIWLWVRMVGS